MKHFIIKSCAVALCSAFLATAAPADPLVDGVVNQLVAQGYSRINVRKAPNQITFTSSLNGVDRVLVVDRRTGALLSDQQANSVSVETGATLSREGDSGWAEGGNGGGASDKDESSADDEDEGDDDGKDEGDDDDAGNEGGDESDSL